MAAIGILPRGSANCTTQLRNENFIMSGDFVANSGVEARHSAIAIDHKDEYWDTACQAGDRINLNPVGRVTPAIVGLPWFITAGVTRPTGTIYNFTQQSAIKATKLPVKTALHKDMV